MKNNKLANCNPQNSFDMNLTFGSFYARVLKQTSRVRSSACFKLDAGGHPYITFWFCTSNYRETPAFLQTKKATVFLNV